MSYKEEILSIIKPSSDEKKENESIAYEALEIIKTNLEKENIDAYIRIGGSFAKNTWLSGDFDCDCFVKFKKGKYSDEEMSNILEKILTFENVLRVHGSRDYFQFNYKGIDFEIVPSLEEPNPQEAENSTDVSIYHIDWLLEKMKSNNNLSDEIRLTKRFFKASQVYGAESYFNGFSGHVIDIMVANFGSFENLLENISSWTKDNKVVIDPNNIYKDKEDALKHLNKSKLNSPIIIIDPILNTRNAAAALRIDKFNRIIDCAKQFLESKETNMFDIPVFRQEDITAKEDEMLFMYKVEHSDNSKDVAGCKVLKSLEYMVNQLKHFNFKINKSGWNFSYKGTSYIYLLIEKGDLSEFDVRRGPPSRVKAHADKFKEKNPNFFEEDGNLFAKVKRKYTNAKDLLSDIINDENIQNRVKKITLFREE